MGSAAFVCFASKVVGVVTTARNDVVVVELSGLVRVCAWCVPRARLIEIHREYKERCTDGLCPECSTRLEQQEVA